MITKPIDGVVYWDEGANTTPNSTPKQLEEELLIDDTGATLTALKEKIYTHQKAKDFKNKNYKKYQKLKESSVNFLDTDSSITTDDYDYGNDEFNHMIKTLRLIETNNNGAGTKYNEITGGNYKLDTPKTIFGNLITFMESKGIYRPSDRSGDYTNADFLYMVGLGQAKVIENLGDNRNDKSATNKSNNFGDNIMGVWTMNDLEELSGGGKSNIEKTLEEMNTFISNFISHYNTQKVDEFLIIDKPQTIKNGSSTAKFSFSVDSGSLMSILSDGSIQVNTDSIPVGTSTVETKFKVIAIVNGTKEEHEITVKIPEKEPQANNTEKKAKALAVSKFNKFQNVNNETFDSNDSLLFDIPKDISFDEGSLVFEASANSDMIKIEDGKILLNPDKIPVKDGTTNSTDIEITLKYEIDSTNPSTSVVISDGSNESKITIKVEHKEAEDTYTEVDDVDYLNDMKSFFKIEKGNSDYKITTLDGYDTININGGKSLMLKDNESTRTVEVYYDGTNLQQNIIKESKFQETGTQEIIIKKIIQTKTNQEDSIERMSYSINSTNLSITSPTTVKLNDNNEYTFTRNMANGKFGVQIVEKADNSSDVFNSPEEMTTAINALPDGTADNFNSEMGIVLNKILQGIEQGKISYDDSLMGKTSLLYRKLLSSTSQSAHNVSTYLIIKSKK